MTEQQQPKTDAKGMSRRNFLKNGGILAGGLVGGSLFGGLLMNQTKKTETTTKEKAALQETYDARIFFSRNEDFDVLSHAVERIFPETAVGPGAIALGVPYFIDRQLSSDWGTNAYDYMTGPFPQIIEVTQYTEPSTNQNEQGVITEVEVPSSTPRYQTRMTRAMVFMEGVQAIEKAAQEKLGSKFIDLEPAQQDEILQLFEEGEVEMNGFNPQDFFGLLRTATIQGAYADPVYGGNRNMAGWEMKEFPGPRMSYLQDIEKEEFIVMKPESLRNYQGH